VDKNIAEQYIVTCVIQVSQEFCKWYYPNIQEYSRGLWFLSKPLI
jgi:hypothetical protein